MRYEMVPRLHTRGPVAEADKRFVYILRSVNNPERRYVGLTADLPARLGAHNAGQNPSTAPWKPWVVDVNIEFRTERMAVRFEKYLKSGSGHEFAKRHFEDRL
jgi:putative endonuclease